MINTAAATAGETAAAVGAWNAQVGNTGAASKYVTSVLMSTDGDAVVTVTYNRDTIGGLAAGQNTLVLTPLVRFGAAQANASYQRISVAQGNGNQGPIDWACASVQANVATLAPPAGRGMPAVALGTLPARFAPSECR